MLKTARVDFMKDRRREQFFAEILDVNALSRGVELAELFGRVSAEKLSFRSFVNGWLFLAHRGERGKSRKCEREWPRVKMGVRRHEWPAGDAPPPSLGIRKNNFRAW